MLIIIVEPSVSKGRKMPPKNLKRRRTVAPKPDADAEPKTPPPPPMSPGGGPMTSPIRPPRSSSSDNDEKQQPLSSEMLAGLAEMTHTIRQWRSSGPHIHEVLRIAMQPYSEYDVFEDYYIARARCVISRLLEDLERDDEPEATAAAAPAAAAAAAAASTKSNY